MATKVMNMRQTQTKPLLIDAFFQLIAKKDFEKITIADITKGAKVNRATFYAHFNDKYELLDYIMGSSASTAIASRTMEATEFNADTVQQLVLAVCDFYEKPNVACRASYIGLVLPQLKEKVVKELTEFLAKSLADVYTEEERNLYVPVIAQAIHEGASQWATGKIVMSEQETATKVASFIMDGFRVPERAKTY
ncbi:TetR/AcrR family transcriptional regulator [Paenibacillus glycanilyticus]|uniref:TetR/AcrR family transcriptional regulator n=1 Tax=Paenibacillus glycanilyticus TaxID=126569 RepID=A0ABQ6GER5_9BACL|nr:TetR/AcrR family transcriptional regulator [Paenibacillus glycanilyticus]GLX68735.1 TetR/AcrR family transcriptional regulator [Paenibacillus glycanilyticus]